MVHVVACDGTPVVGADVEWLVEARRPTRARTDGTGAALLSPVSVGTVALVKAWSAAHGFAFVGPIVAEGRRHELRLVLQQRTTAGRVEGREGEALGGARVIMRRRLEVRDAARLDESLRVRLWHEFEATADESGNFVVGGAGGGVLSVTPRGHSLPVHHAQIADGANDVVVRVGGGLAWSGRVRSATGEALPTFFACARFQSARVQLHRLEGAFASADGTFDIALPIDGTWFCAVHAPGHSPRAARLAPSGGSTDWLLHRTTGVAVTVIDATGMPLAEACLGLTYENGDPALCQVSPGNWSSRLPVHGGKARLVAAPATAINVQVFVPRLAEPIRVPLDLGRSSESGVTLHVPASIAYPIRTCRVPAPAIGEGDVAFELIARDAGGTTVWSQRGQLGSRIEVAAVGTFAEIGFDATGVQRHARLRDSIAWLPLGDDPTRREFSVELSWQAHTLVLTTERGIWSCDVPEGGTDVRAALTPRR